MCLCRMSLLAFGCCGFAFGQPGNAPRLGAASPTLDYQEAPDWPTQATNAAGKPAAWNFIQVSGVAIDARGH
jgi:hypothetical protein